MIATATANGIRLCPPTLPSYTRTYKIITVGGGGLTVASLTLTITNGGKKAKIEEEKGRKEGGSNRKGKRVVRGPADSYLPCSMFPSLVSNVLHEKSIFTTGPYDNHLRVFNLRDNSDDNAVNSNNDNDIDVELLQQIAQHTGAITTITTGEDGRTIVTGSRDCTLSVWKMGGEVRKSLIVGGVQIANNDNHHSGPLGLSALDSSSSSSLSSSPLVHVRTLIGHEQAIVAVAINVDLDTVVSSSRDGLLCLHSLSSGKLVGIFVLFVSFVF